MKKTVLTLVMVLCAMQAYAADFKMGYVDMQRVVVQSDKGKEAQETVTSIEKAQTTLINEQIKEIKRLEETLAKQEAIMTPKAREEKTAELNKMILDYQMKGKQYKEELQNKQDQLIREIVDIVNVILEKIAKEEGYNAILHKAGVVYMTDKNDLTDNVIQKLNEATAQ